MSFLPPILALLAALLGVLDLGGKTWNPHAKGWRRLTLKGRLTLVLASASFVAAILLTAKKSRADEYASLQRSQISELATHELCVALIEYKLVLDVLWSAASNTGSALRPTLGVPFAVLIADSSRERLLTIDLSAPVQAMRHVGAAGDMASFVTTQTNDAVSRLNTAITKYSYYLPAELQLPTNRLVVGNFTRRLQNTERNVAFIRLQNDDALSYPVLYSAEDPDYLEAITLADSLSNMLGASEDLTCPNRYRPLR